MKESTHTFFSEQIMTAVCLGRCCRRHLAGHKFSYYTSFIHVQLSDITLTTIEYENVNDPISKTIKKRIETMENRP